MTVWPLAGAQRKLFQIVMGSVKTNTNNPISVSVSIRKSFDLLGESIISFKTEKNNSQNCEIRIDESTFVRLSRVVY